LFVLSARLLRRRHSPAAPPRPGRDGVHAFGGRTFHQHLQVHRMLAVRRLAKPFLCRCGREPGNGSLAFSDPSPNVRSKVAPERGHMDPAIV